MATLPARTNVIIDVNQKLAIIYIFYTEIAHLWELSPTQQIQLQTKNGSERFRILLLINILPCVYYNYSNLNTAWNTIDKKKCVMPVNDQLFFINTRLYITFNYPFTGMNLTQPCLEFIDTDQLSA